MIAIVVDASKGQAVLRIVGENLGDLSAPFKKAGELLLEDARSQIVSQGALFGTGWAPMHPLTHVIATALYGRGRDPRTLLQDTRGLIDSLTPDGGGNVFEVGPMEARFGSSYVSPRTGFPIGKGQQDGTSRTFHVLQGAGFSETGIPGREFLAWRGERIDDYHAIFVDHLGEGL